MTGPTPDETLKLEVDFSALTIGDLLLFDKLAAGQTSNAELVALLDRVVVGGAAHLPLTRLKEIIAAIQAATPALANPGLAEKN